jgi:hypothetical protein
MAALSVDDAHPSYVEIRVDGEGVPITFPVGSDGLALVTTLRLSLLFQLNTMSLHIDEDVYDTKSGDLIHTISQSPVCVGDGKHWLLRPGRFRLYGLSESVMAATTSLATPLSSPSCTIQTPFTSKVKVEVGLQSVTILSDDSDMSSLLYATSTKTPSRTSPSLDPAVESPVCPSNTSSQPDLKQPSSVLDCLRKLCASKGSRNALKGLDYDIVRLLRMDFLPLVFNGEVVFELPPIGSSVGNSQA